MVSASVVVARIVGTQVVYYLYSCWAVPCNEHAVCNERVVCTVYVWSITLRRSQELKVESITNAAA